MAEQSGEVTAEGSEGEWMNAAFALDDLHERADLQALAVDLDTLDRQLQPLASPIAPLDMASMALASFLSEIDACSNVIADPKQPERIGLLPQTATPAPERAGALRLMPKKKKLSSLQRTRQAKALVQLEIAQLEQRIKHIRREHYQALALRRAKRWKPIVQNEVQQTETKNAEQLQLWTSIKNEQQKARVALEFVMKMRELMQVSELGIDHQSSAETQSKLHDQASLARIPLCVPRLETDQDAAIFHALAWNVRVKSQALDYVLPTHSAASELSLGKLSANGECAELEFVRFLPFDVPTTSRVTWNCAQSDVGSAHTAVVRSDTELS